MMNKSKRVKIVRVNMEATHKASTLPTEPARPVPQESAKRQEGHIHVPQNDLLEEILTSYRAFCRSNGVKSTPIGMTSYLRSLQPGLFNQLKKLCRPLRVCELQKCRSNWQAKLIIVPVYRQGRDIGLITNTEWLDSQVQKFKEKLKNRKASAREIVTGPYVARRLTLDQVPDELMAPISPVKGRIWLNIQKNQFNKTVAALFRGSRKAMIERIALNAKPEFRKLTYYLFIDRILNKYLFKAAMRVFARDYKKILGEYCDVTLQEQYDKIRAAKPQKKPLRVIVTRKTAAEKLDQQKKEHEQKAVRRNPPAQHNNNKPVVIELPDIGKQLDNLMEAIAFRLRKERDATTTNIPLLVKDLNSLVPKLCPNCTEAGQDAVDEIIQQFKGGLRGGHNPEEDDVPPPPPLEDIEQEEEELVHPYYCRPSQSLDIDPIDIEWWQAHHLESPSEYETDLSTDEEIQKQHIDYAVVTQAGLPVERATISEDWALESPRSLDDLRTVWRTVSYTTEDPQEAPALDTPELNDPTAEIFIPPDQGIIYESEPDTTPTFSSTDDDVVVPCVDYETPGKLEEKPIVIESQLVAVVGDDGSEHIQEVPFSSLGSSEQAVLLADKVEEMDEDLRIKGIYPPSQQQLLDEARCENKEDKNIHVPIVQRVREERQRRRQFRTQIKQIAAKNKLLLGAKTSIQRQPECFKTLEPQPNVFENNEARQTMDQDKVSGLFDPVPDIMSDRKDRVECKKIKRPPGCLFVTTTAKHEVVDENGNYYNGPPAIRKREPIKILPKNAVGMITRLGHPIVVDITKMRKTTVKSQYFYINQAVDYPWDFHPVAIQGDHVIHWLDPQHPHFKRDKVGGSDSEDDQGVMSDDGGGDGYDDMGDEAEVVEEDSKNKKNKSKKDADQTNDSNDWEEKSDKDEKIDLDYTKKFSPLQYMIASAMAFTLVQINLAFIFLYFLILIGLPATRWSSRIKKVFSNDVDRRPATKATINRQLIVSTLRKTRGIYNPFFGWIYKWSRTESDFNDTMVQMYAWETANKLEKPDKTLFYARYKDQINNSVNQVERWRKTTLKAMKIVDRQRTYVPATFWLLTYLVGYSAAATDNIPIKPTKQGFHMNVSPIDQKDPTVWYGLLSPKEMARLEYAPCVPDRNDQDHTILGAINRIGVDNSEFLDIGKYESTIDKVIEEMFTGYTDVAPPLDSDAMYEWILTRPYTAHQIRELLETLTILNTMDLKYEDIITRREWQTMGFGKNENYEKYKFMRMICAGGPMRKLIYGPLFQGLSDWFFKQPWSMKKISSHERGDWLAAKFPKYGHYYVTDHSNFECSATSQVQDAIEMKVYRKFIHPSNHDFLEFLSHGIKGGHTIYTRKGVVIHTPVVRNSGEMNTSLGNSILNAVSAKVAFDTMGAHIEFVVEGDDGLILSDKYVDPAEIQRIMSEMGCRIKIEYHHSMETTSFCSTCFVDGTPTTDWKRNFVKVPWKSTFTSEEDRLTELRRKIGSLAMNARNSAISKALVQFYHAVEASYPNDMYIKETLLEPLKVAYEHLPTMPSYEETKEMSKKIGRKVVDTTAAVKEILAEGAHDAKEMLRTGYNALKKDPEFTGRERIEKLEARIEQLHSLLEKQQEVITDMGKMVFQYSQNFSEIITNIPAKILEELRQPINFTDIYNDASTMKVPIPVIENAVNLTLSGKLPEAINSVYSAIPDTADLHDMASNIKNSTAGESPGGFRYTRPPQQFQFLDAFKKYKFRQFTSAFGVALSIGDYLMQFASPEFWFFAIMALFIAMDQLVPLSPITLLVLFNGNIFAYLAASILLVRTNRYFRVFISVLGAVVMNLFLFGPFAFGFIAGLAGQNHYNKF